MYYIMFIIFTEFEQFLIKLLTTRLDTHDAMCWNHETHYPKK